MIKVLLTTFWQPYAHNLKHLRICKLRLLVNEFPDMMGSWNLHWGYPLIKKLFDNFINLVTLVAPGLVCKLFIFLLPNLSPPNFNFIACVEDEISSKDLYSRNNFQENSFGHLHDVIYRPHLSKGILNESFQTIPYHKICK